MRNSLAVVILNVCVVAFLFSRNHYEIQAIDGVGNYDNILYRAVDKPTFELYTHNWVQEHVSWIGIEDASTSVCKHGYYFPTCVDGTMLGLPYTESCGDMVCYDENYAVGCDLVTPPDTIDYTPPIPENSLDNTTICPSPTENPYLLGPSFGLDQGLPPYFTPMARIPLKIHGTIKTAFGKYCNVVKGATIEAWHVDVGKLPLAVRTEYPLEETPLNLKAASCRGYIETDETGSYEFTTSLPASYGPPRHINFVIKADGFQTLTTRLYFADDWRLQQTAPLEGEPTEFRRVKHINTKVAATIRGFIDSDDDTSQGEGTAIFEHRNSTNQKPIKEDIPLPGVLTNDPRVRPLELIVENTTSSGAIYQGYYRTEFNIVLKPLRPLEQKIEEGIDPSKSPLTPATDIEGLWNTRDGGQVKIETNGHTFIAIEWPHIRNWGTVAGVLNGDTIRGVDFRSSKAIAEHHDLNSENMSYAPWTKLQKLSKMNSENRINRLIGLWNFIPDSIWTNGVSTGVVIPRDEFVTDPRATVIRWSGNSYDQDWSRVIEEESYRYLKLQITRETGGFEGGKMVINEIVFYEGILGQRAYPTPDMYMKNPRFPSPQIVTCSSFVTQESHCFRAFDGIETSNSTWMTQPIGSRNHVLTKPQHVLIDFGKGRGILPTALKIVCDSGHPTNPKGCPMTFVLSGSNDNIRFKTLFKQDYFDYNNEYANGGAVNHFYWSSSIGRTLGHRCGSCDVGPNYNCKLDQYDSSCASRYCGKEGLCKSPPTCEAGFYLDSTIPFEANDPVASCVMCPSGRYGAIAGLRTPSCSGPCKEGYYCTGGATTPTQHECGHVGVFCPEGSAKPVPSSAGRRTISTSDHIQHYNFTSGLKGENQEGQFRFQSEESKSVMVQDTLCEMGHYCVNGEQFLCPEGTYGNATGLATVHCTDICASGTYCPPRSIIPTICSRGHYCPDGTRQVPCPAGTFGATRGLKDRTCTGLTKPGFYSSDGSTAPILCPAGKYGESSGLRDSDCSGDCDDGHYCPGPPIDPITKDHTGRMAEYHPNTNYRQHRCGSPSVYCPRGSPNPIVVSNGYYSAGGVEETRSTQVKCERGYYCVQGVKYSCPAGTYGDMEGLSYNYLNQNENICSGFCDKGYYCPPNSTSATQYPCPPGTYGNPANHSGLVDEKCTNKCPLGRYCPAATVHPIKCPAGRFGNSTGLTTDACAAACEHTDGYCDTSISLCDPGYYCPEGSLTSTQYVCGAISKYCPKGSAQPVPVDLGYYSVGPLTPRSESTLAMTGVSVEFGEFDRFPNVLYQEGVRNEFWAINRRTGQKICEKGYFCYKGAKTKCPPGTYGSTDGLFTENCTAPCPLGHYCPQGTARGEYEGGSINGGTGRKCPAGRYGGELGLEELFCSGECDNGFVCPRGSSSPQQMQCGSYEGLIFWVTSSRRMQGSWLPSERSDVEAYVEKLIDEVATDPSSCISTIGFPNSMPNTSCNRNRKEALEQLGNIVYCPQGITFPVEVLPGYYTIGGNSTTRSDQLPCPPGSYCNKGIIRECPAGRFGSSVRLSNSACSGPCDRGFYCPAGSTSNQENPCPIGRYGSTEGLKTAACTDSCTHPLDCNLASVHDGYLPHERYPSVW